MRAAIGISTALLLLWVGGCSGRGGQEYTPVFAPVTTAASAARTGGLRADYDEAARAKTLHDAKARWEQFLKQHKPANGEYEDAFQKRLIDSATYELVRICYLTGDRDKGDQLLRELDPLQLR